MNRVITLFTLWRGQQTSPFFMQIRHKLSELKQENFNQKRAKIQENLFLIFKALSTKPLCSKPRISPAGLCAYNQDRTLTYFKWGEMAQKITPHGRSPCTLALMRRKRYLAGRLFLLLRQSGCSAAPDFAQLALARRMCARLSL